MLRQLQRNKRRAIAKAVAEFLDETKPHKKARGSGGVHDGAEHFTEYCPKLCLKDIERRDLLEFSAYGRMPYARELDRTKRFIDPSTDYRRRNTSKKRRAS